MINDPEIDQLRNFRTASKKQKNKKTSEKKKKNNSNKKQNEENKKNIDNQLNDNIININEKQDLNINTSDSYSDPKENATNYSNDNDNFSFNNIPLEKNNSPNKANPSRRRNNRNNSQNNNNNNNQPQGSTGRNINREVEEIFNNNRERIPFYIKYIYSINKDIEINTSSINSNRRIVSNYSYWDIFLAKTISENTLFFVFNWSRFDKNGYFIRLAIFILYIGWYMFFNILTEINTTTLNFIIHKDENNHSLLSFLSFFSLNAILPYFVVSLIIRYFKEAISLREFYLKEIERIENKKSKYENNKELLKNIMNEERTNIKKFKNYLNNNVKIVVTLGYLILILNAILSYCFFGVYQNSFWCIVVNVLVSILLNFAISIIINILETITKCNCKIFLLFLYAPCCVACYYILNKITGSREEFNDLKNDDYYYNEDSRNHIVVNQTSNNIGNIIA